MNNDKKRIINPPRDLGPNNSVRREHLDIWKVDLPSYLINERICKARIHKAFIHF